MICRNCQGHDICNKPGNGHVLGNLSLERNGNHGKKLTDHSESFTLLMLSAFCISADCFCLCGNRKHTQWHVSST